MSIATELTRMAQNAASVDAAKTAIASAITDKGGTVGASDGLEDFAAAIAGIPSGGGVPSNIRIATFTALSYVSSITVEVDPWEGNVLAAIFASEGFDWDEWPTLGLGQVSVGGGLSYNTSYRAANACVGYKNATDRDYWTNSSHINTNGSAGTITITNGVAPNIPYTILLIVGVKT